MQCVAACKHCCGEGCENVSQHTNTCEVCDGDESSFDDDDGMELVDEIDGIVNDAWDDEGSLILFRTEQFHILLWYFSLHFNGHFPGGLGLASTRMSSFWIILELRVIEACKVPVKILPPTNQHPDFYRLDALSVAQPTV